MPRSKTFTVSGGQIADANIASIIRQITDELNRLHEVIESQSAGQSRLVSDRQPFRVQTVDKGVHVLEVDTPDGVKKIPLTNME